MSTIVEDRVRYLRNLAEAALEQNRIHLYPHQIPPTSDWFFWLLEAGRGAGKTAAAAYYVREHLNGPRCFPPTPGERDLPHRVSLIAPTLGDGIESANLNDQALTRIEPGAKLTTAGGGTRVDWPNGSQVRIFGAHTREDVNRLRAGGNRCLVAGTLVRTIAGDIPIEHVQPGDQVQTRGGWRTVLRSGQTGVRRVVTVTMSDGTSITGTPDHLVWTGQEWQPLSVAATVGAWNTSNTTASDGTNAKTATTGTADTDSSIAASTHEKSGISRTERTFTTRTTTRTTTPPRISSRSHRGNTGTNTKTSDATTGTVVEARHSGNAGWRPSGSVISAAPPIVAVQPTRGGAGRDAATRVHERSRLGCALCAETSSPAKHDARPRLVPLRVVHRTRISNDAEPVFDLLVEHDHEFVANGIIVANCLIWAEEIAAWRYLADAWADMMFGLRIGEKVRIVGSTTPRPRPEYLEIRKQADVIAHATTLDNPALNDEQKARLVEIYGDSSIGRQEIYGELLEEAEGALWSYPLIEENRIDMPDQVGRIVVGLDPPGGVTEAGIVACGEIPNCRCGQPRLPHYAVLEDASGVYTPEQWAATAVATLDAWKGDRIVAEKNYGGDMVEATIRTVDPDVPVRNVTASRGKRLRAEPIKALYEQRRVHHVGVLGELETEMVQWIPDESPWSPNRLDALVWALTDLSTKGRRPSIAGMNVDSDLYKPRGL